MLVRLEIEGFRIFQDKFVLDLRSPSKDPINYFVLAGVNGSGKTTILEAIYLLLGGSVSTDIKDNTRLSAEIQDLSSKATYRVERTTAPAERINFAVEYLSAQSTHLSERLRKLDPLLGHEWLNKLNTYWREFRDDGSHFVLREWDLVMRTVDGRMFSVDALSSGEQAVLNLAAPLVNNPFEGVLLIDYPEQYLHPRWAGRVVRALRNLAPKAQVIVATHADDPWDDAKSWERRLLEESKNEKLSER